MTIGKPKILGVIMARGGSKRIPLKNLKQVDGRPLVAWVIAAAVKSKTLSRVLVSTDHEGIAKVALECGAEVPFRRPKDLSEDVPSAWVTRHAAQWVEAEGWGPVDIAVTLHPTTPFVSSADIDACVQTLQATGADAVITVSPIRQRPEWMVRLNSDGRLEWQSGKAPEGDANVSQNLPPLFVPNGGVYATRRAIIERGEIFGSDTRAVEMSLESSVDIDEPIDLLVAEAILKSMPQAGRE